MDRELVGEYIQFPKIAKDFANYLELYYKYRDDYQVEQVLEGHISEAAVDKLQRASFDERISVVSLLLSGLNEKFRNVIRMEELMSLRMEQMKKLQSGDAAAVKSDAAAAGAELSVPETAATGAHEQADANAGTGSALADVLSALAESFHAEWSRLLDNSLLSRARLRTCRAVSAKLEEDLMELRKSGITDWNEGFALLRERFGADSDRYEELFDEAGEALEHAFDFMEAAFAGSQELVKDDDAMIETADSIKKYGVLVPAIARPLPDGGYELVAGHRRRRASELAGKETMPVIVRDLDDDAATIIMVDSNLQRENLLPSERAFAYKMKLEAIKHQGARTDLTSVQVEQKLSARDQVAKEAGERSGIQVMRYVRLTELIPELLDMVDEKKIAFNPAYELSFLKPDEQQMLVETMDYEQATPSLSQAQRMKKFSQEGKLSEDVMLAIMSEEKKGDLDKVTLSSDTLRKYFPKSYTPAKMQETIIKLLEQWQKKRQRDQER